MAGTERVVAVGLDAAEWSLIEPWMADGTLPNLAALAQQATRARLGNVREYRSESVWTQFLTGRGSDDSGYWTNVAFDPEHYEVTDIGASGIAPFWGRAGTTPAIVFDVPHVVPYDDPDVTIVAGWGAHSALSPRSSRPEGLLSEIDARFGPHPACNRDGGSAWHDAAHLEALTDACVEGARRRVDVIEWLLARQPDWRLLITVMSEPHSVGHHAWHGVDPEHLVHDAATGGVAATCLRRAYQAVDAAIGRLAEALPDDATLVVFALHGMQANTNDVPGIVLLPELLYRLDTGERLLDVPSASWDRRGKPPRLPVMTYGHDLALVFGAGRGAQLRRLAARLPGPLLRTAVTLRNRLTGKPAPKEVFGQEAITPEAAPDDRWLEELDWQNPTWYREHWPRLRAFALPTFSDGQIRINLQGRERNGVVPAEDYAAECERITAELRRWTDARTGGPVVADVVAVRADDPFAPGGPPADLVVLFHPGVDAAEHPTAGRIGPVPLIRTGEHSSNGFAMVSGPGIERSDLGARPARDVTPTLLSLLGADRTAVDGTPLVGRPTLEVSR